MQAEITVEALQRMVDKLTQFRDAFADRNDPNSAWHNGKVNGMDDTIDLVLNDLLLSVPIHDTRKHPHGRC